MCIRDRSVRGYRVSTVSSIRSAIEPLQAAWPFDVIQHGYGIKFKLRGSSSAVSYTHLDVYKRQSLPSITVTGTFTAVTNSLIMRDSARAEAADRFAYGTLEITSGTNAGLKRQEVKRYEADGTIEVFEPFHYVPLVGDTYTLIPGCRKRLADCRDKHSNIINFLGFSHVPTSSQYSQIGGA